MSTRYLTSTRTQALDARLSSRDLAITRTVCSLRYLSGSQLQRMHIPDGTPLGRVRTSRRVLARLTKLSVLARLERRIGGPLGPGSGDYVYTLGVGGQRVAQLHGWLPTRRSRQPLAPGLAFLAHRLQVAELHVRVMEGVHSGRYELQLLQA